MYLALPLLPWSLIRIILELLQTSRLPPRRNVLALDALDSLGRLYRFRFDLVRRARLCGWDAETCDGFLDLEVGEKSAVTGDIGFPFEFAVIYA
jgi:hypothetical protein